MVAMEPPSYTPLRLLRCILHDLAHGGNSKIESPHPSTGDAWMGRDTASRDGSGIDPDLPSLPLPRGTMHAPYHR